MSPQPAVLPVPASLPASLTIIEEDAFSGTAFTSIQLPDTVRRLEARAFAEMPNLRFVLIPAAIEQIADDLFAGSAAVTVLGAPGSLAEQWAARHGFNFLSQNAWIQDTLFSMYRKIQSEKLLLSALFLSALGWLVKFSRRKLFFLCRDGMWSMRPQDRPELYPINYRFP